MPTIEMAPKFGLLHAQDMALAEDFFFFQSESTWETILLKG